MEQIGFLFRSPRLPAIVIGRRRMKGALTKHQLVNELEECETLEPARELKVVDSTGEEFRFHVELRVLSPGIAYKKWTKKELIDLYNANRNRGTAEYSSGSLQNRRLDKVVTDIVELLRDD